MSISPSTESEKSFLFFRGGLFWSGNHQWLNWGWRGSFNWWQTPDLMRSLLWWTIAQIYGLFTQVLRLQIEKSKKLWPEMLQMHYWRASKASKFNAVHCDPGDCWCRLAPSPPLWVSLSYEAPFRGGPGCAERGLKDHSEEFWCHISGQSFSHLCGGAANAPEQVGEDLKKEEKNPSGAHSRALTSCINKTITPLPLNVKSCWTHTVIVLLVACVKSCDLKVSELSQNIPFCRPQRPLFSFFFLFPAGCRVLPGVEGLTEKSWRSGMRRSAPTFCACFQTGRGYVVRFTVCYSNATPQEPLDRYLFLLFWRPNVPHGRSALWPLLRGEAQKLLLSSVFF